MESQNHCSRNQEVGVGAEKGFEGTVRKDKMLVNETEWTAMVAGCRSYGKCQLKDNVKEVGQIQDYIKECLRTSGDQYNRALQDLVNYTASFLQFDVAFGRYQGVQGQLGFEGHWKSPTGFHIVAEIKTTDAYAINCATLAGYVDGLISEKKIPDWDKTLGLYVVGRLRRRPQAT